MGKYWDNGLKAVYALRTFSSRSPIVLFPVVQYYQRRRYIMALPIKDTPVLKGKDAERFFKMAEENVGKTVPVEEARAAREAYDLLMPHMKKDKPR